MFANDHSIGGAGAGRPNIAASNKPSNLKPSLRGVSAPNQAISGQTAQTNQQLRSRTAAGGV